MKGEGKEGKRSPKCSLVNHGPYFKYINSLTLTRSEFCDSFLVFDSALCGKGSLNVES